VPLAEVLAVKLSEALNKAKADFTALMKVVTWLWQNILEPLVVFIGGAFSTIFNNAFEMMCDVIDGATLAFKGLMDFITGVFTGDWDKAWNGVKDVFSGIFSSLYGIVKAPLNLIIDAINTVISGINSISFNVPDWVPGIGGKAFSVNIPKMTKLASGGITNGPMAAIIGDNVGGREVVSPLSDLQDMLVSAVGTAMLQANQFSNSGRDKEVVLKIKDTEIARAILPAIDKERSRIGYVALQGG
jgi:phage-related protein